MSWLKAGRRGEFRFVPADVRASIAADQGNWILGRHMKNITKSRFKEKQPILKLTLAHKYCGWLETANPTNESVNVFRKFWDA